MSKVRQNCSLDEHIHEFVQDIARENKISVSAAINMLLHKEWRRQRPASFRNFLGIKDPKE